jgi:hypothetical protein
MAANPFGAHWVGVYKPTAWPGDTRLSHDVVGRAGNGLELDDSTGTPFCTDHMHAFECSADVALRFDFAISP